MKIIHIVVGEENAKSIQESVSITETSNQSIFILKDCLNIGTLKSEMLPFSEHRNKVSQVLKPNQKSDYIDDLARLMQLSTQISNGAEISLIFWMSSNAEDVCAYYWLLHFLKKHQGKFAVINISGLPFLDEQMQLFYPKTIAEIPSKQIIKALKLKRVISTSEWEAEGEEWKMLVAENAEIRYLVNGKNILSKKVDFYDGQIIAALEDNKKSNKIRQDFIVKSNFSYSALPFLNWRINEINKTTAFRQEDTL